jgi:hypothetical protein
MGKNKQREKTMSSSDDREVQIEVDFRKSFYEYLKHISGLSTGSILLLAAFLEKFFLQPEWKSLIGVSIGGFLLAVISSVISYSILVLNFPGRGAEMTEWEKYLVTGSTLVTWLGFLTGIISLSIFILRNFFV